MATRLTYLFVLLVAFGCSTGRKAFDQGNYFDAVRTSVERLRGNPTNRKAAQVLESGYPMALKWSQDEIDLLLSSNDPLKWEKTVSLMEQVNRLASDIRLSPAALRIIPEPKVYSHEMNMARERAAEETYLSAEVFMREPSREAARKAWSLYARSLELVPGYRDSAEKMAGAREKATLHVVVEPIPVHSSFFQVSADFFYNQVFEYLNRRYPARAFVRFYDPVEMEQAPRRNPDMIVRLEFFDFMVGNVLNSAVEKEVSQVVKVDTKDTTKNETITYKAKLKTFTDKVTSAGVVDLKIVEYPSGRLLVNDRIPGEYVWMNQYALFVGDEKALTKEELQLTKRKLTTPPPAQALFVEFTKPIYEQLTGRLTSFFNRYN